MNSARSKVAVLVAVLAGISCDALAASYLSGVDLQKALVGKTLASTSKRGISYAVTFTSTTAGTYSMWPAGPSGRRDDSDLSLNFTNDSVCFESAKYRFQECNKVVVDGGKYDFVDAKTGTINNVYEAR
jgi:hypothetical protein